jgi:predicted phage baseplate assembly protein
MRSATADPPRIVWEYLTADGAWRSLGAADETAAFSRRGMIRFLGPADLGKRPLFGETLCWLRARLAGGQFPVPPRLRRVLTNTVWAGQAVTSRREILGSGNGEPNQTLRTAQAPALPGCRVLVREPELSPEAAARLGADIERDETGDVSEIWVPWTAVADFYASGPADRHVRVNAETGEVRFGDGRHGRLPPRGANNIRITYRSGGGERGNLSPGTINELKSSIPYIESVANHVASSGGGDAQAPASVERYGPRRLRHRGRAVTAQDLEDLAFAASTQVARAQAITPQFDSLGAPPTTGGGVGLIIVPRGAGKRPTPDLGLIEQVEAYLRARCPATAALRVSGPIWRRVDVTLTAVPLAPAAADQLAQDIQNRLDQFLHPLHGGGAGKGWPFNRRPQPSDLYGALHGLPGLDHVRALSLRISGDGGDALPFLIYPGAHTITLVVN